MMTAAELAERGWPRCESCGAIRSPYSGLDCYNHAAADCEYSRANGFIITACLCGHGAARHNNAAHCDMCECEAYDG